MKYVPNIDTSIPYITHYDNEKKDDNISVNNDVNEVRKADPGFRENSSVCEPI